MMLQKHLQRSLCLYLFDAQRTVFRSVVRRAAMILARGSQLYRSAGQSDAPPIRRFGRRLRFAVLCDSHPFTCVFPFFHEGKTSCLENAVVLYVCMLVKE